MAKLKRPEYADVAEKEPTYKHKALAEWLSEVTGYDVDEKSVQLSMSLANTFRATPAFAASEEAHAKARQDEKDARKASRAAQIRERAERLAAQAAELAAQADQIAPAAKAPAKKAAAKKAAAPKAPKPEPEPSNVTPLHTPADDDDEF